MTRPANPASVAGSSPATSSWANSVVDAIVAICADIYGVTNLAIPWASLTGIPASFTPAVHTHADASHGGTVAYSALTGKPATFAPTLAAAVAATTFGLAKVDGVSGSAAHADHIHGTPSLGAAVAATTYGLAKVDGVSASAAHADHIHGTPSLGAAVAATTYGLAKVDGTSGSAAHADHIHGTPAAQTLASLGAAAAYDTPATADGGKRIYVGSSTPTGASEGDVWIKG
jgi:hypothetical protein